MGFKIKKGGSLLDFDSWQCIGPEWWPTTENDEFKSFCWCSFWSKIHQTFLERDLCERGRSGESVTKQYLDSVRPMH